MSVLYRACACVWRGRVCATYLHLCVFVRSKACVYARTLYALRIPRRICQTVCCLSTFGSVATCDAAETAALAAALAAEIVALAAETAALATALAAETVAFAAALTAETVALAAETVALAAAAVGGPSSSVVPSPLPSPPPPPITAAAVDLRFPNQEDIFCARPQKTSVCSI